MNQFQSSEDYLERILMLKKKSKYVRAIDIAADMNFSKASVSIALKKLKVKELITVSESDGDIELTTKGYEIASSILERHEVITTFLTSLGVEQSIAEEDACKIEHDISKETFEALKKKFKPNN